MTLWCWSGNDSRRKIFFSLVEQIILLFFVHVEGVTGARVSMANDETRQGDVIMFSDPQGAAFCTGGVPDRRPETLWTKRETRLWDIAIIINNKFCTVVNPPTPTQPHLRKFLFVANAAADYGPVRRNIGHLMTMLDMEAESMLGVFPTDAALEYHLFYGPFDYFGVEEDVMIRVDNVTLRKSRFGACKSALTVLSLFLKRYTRLAKDVRLMCARLIWDSRRENIWDISGEPPQKKDMWDLPRQLPVVIEAEPAKRIPLAKRIKKKKPLYCLSVLCPPPPPRASSGSTSSASVPHVSRRSTSHWPLCARSIHSTRVMNPERWA